MSNFAVRLTSAVFAILVGSLASANAAGPMRPFHFGLWSGGAFTNDQTGAFSHCVASVPYNSGITMLVIVSRQFGWSLGFFDPQWSLTPQEQIPIQLHFDGGPAVRVVGASVSPTLVFVPMPDNSRLVSAFRGSSLMTAQARGQWFLFNLNGTSNVLVQLVNCVKTELALETGHQPVAPGLETPPVPSQDTALEETRLATNFLLAAQLPGAHLIDKSEVPIQLASYGAVWKAANAAGAVKIYAPQPKLTGLDLASQLIASDSESCKGKFASARYSELVDNNVVVRAVTSCSDSSGDTEAQYFVAPRPNGGFAAFSTLGVTPAQRQEISTRQSVDAFKKAALTAVAEH